MTDRIPTIEKYRGVAVHNFQPRLRIDSVVKPAIDLIFDMAAMGQLFDYSCDIRNVPEARIFAAEKCIAIFEDAVEERRKRPDVDCHIARGVASILSSTKWRSPTYYGSLLDTPGGPGPDGRRHVPRETPLEEMQCTPRYQNSFPKTL